MRLLYRLVLTTRQGLLRCVGSLPAAVVITFVAAPAHAATISAVSCSSAAVQTVIDAAKDGDTVLVPAGECTWNTSVNILEKTIIFRGAGSGAGGTKILYGGTNHTLINVNAGSKTGRLEVSGFWLVGGDANYWNGTALQLYGPAGWKNVRVHDMVFQDNYPWAVKLGAATYGVMDNCVFRGRTFGIMTYGRGATDWATPLTLGSSDFFFIEDNTFDFSDFYGETGVPALDMNAGGRIVFRNNSLRYAMWETHDKARSGLASAHAYEIYNNTFWTGTSKWKGIDISAGTGVVWGNVFTGSFTYPIAGMDYKSFDPRSVRLCDGTDPADQNVTGESGWRCQYQIGSHGEGAQAVGYPLYLWNNVANGAPTGMTITAGANHVKAGRDYFNNGTTPQPGYSPFAYPHPLRSGAETSLTAPAKPLNLRITSNQ